MSRVLQAVTFHFPHDGDAEFTLYIPSSLKQSWSLLAPAVRPVIAPTSMTSPSTSLSSAVIDEIFAAEGPVQSSPPPSSAPQQDKVEVKTVTIEDFTLFADHIITDPKLMITAEDALRIRVLNTAHTLKFPLHVYMPHSKISSSLSLHMSPLVDYFVTVILDLLSNKPSQISTWINAFALPEIYERDSSQSLQLTLPLLPPEELKPYFDGISIQILAMSSTELEKNTKAGTLLQSSNMRSNRVMSDPLDLLSALQREPKLTIDTAVWHYSRGTDFLSTASKDPIVLKPLKNLEMPPPGGSSGPSFFKSILTLTNTRSVGTSASYVPTQPDDLDDLVDLEMPSVPGPAAAVEERDLKRVQPSIDIREVGKFSDLEREFKQRVEEWKQTLIKHITKINNPLLTVLLQRKLSRLGVTVSIVEKNPRIRHLFSLPFPHAYESINIKSPIKVLQIQLPFLSRYLE